MSDKQMGGASEREQNQPEVQPSSNPAEWQNFNEIIRWRGEHQPERLVFAYLTDGERETHRLTFSDLLHRASAVAHWLKEHNMQGERVLLLYPAGLDFIIGFYGCMFAGAIGVPAYPPHPRRPDPRLNAIFDNCKPKAAFCIESEFENVSNQLAERNVTTLATDTLAPATEVCMAEDIDHDTVGYLQYTSGSTGNPKGVVITHGNLLYQCAFLMQGAGLTADNFVHINWQPFFHDMGLVGSVSLPIYTAGVAYHMAPAAFLRKPIRWLEAASKYRATSIPGPNFSFELCVTQTTPEQREGLDLSSLIWAWNGAEPIRADTVNQFSELYEPLGFRRQAHYPCYGMAETTLGCILDRTERDPIIAGFDREALEQHRGQPCDAEDENATRLVSSGRLTGDMDVVIADPEQFAECAEGQVGEIWVAGPSVAHGYWDNPETTEETFQARITGSDAGPYLRTGDMGFMHDGELYVTGRLKDMIIVRGRNVYPQDIELAVQRSHAALQGDACAAFAIQEDEHEEIAIAIEVKRTERRREDFTEVFEAIRSTVAENFGVSVHWIGLIQPGRIPKTSSGKIMRRACRKDYLEESLPLLTEWRGSLTRASKPAAKETASGPGLVERLHSLPPALRHQTLITHLQGEVGRSLDLQAMPDPQKGFELLGIDSMEAVKLVNTLQDQLEDAVELPTTLLFDQPNIEAVARYLEQALFGLTTEAVAPVTGKSREAGAADDPIAIVGLACRFPGAANAEEYWKLLEEGHDAIREVPDTRWNLDAYFDQDAATPGKMNTRYGGFMSDIDGFDAGFFDISPREATSMDPQHRHLLEVSWLALENAGIAPGSLNGEPVGVFVGISTGDYDQVLSAQGADSSDAFSATGNAHSAAAGRLSFLLGLQGPCLAVDTACSSSLVAIHQAVQSLRLGECEAALVGGVNAILRPDITVAFSKARLLAPDGRCKTFDASADGYVRSEGCGMVVLKRLSDARRDGNPVHAVIRGSAINQDGRSSGLTAPNGPSQSQVIANALANGGVEPNQVKYLECHGTGTVLGDPIEVQAADKVYAEGRDADAPLMIGSVKTNMGHLEAAAGIAGLIKVVLSLSHGQIPRSLHFKTPNPHIPWASLNLRVVAEPVAWDQVPGTHIAGVSSFGFAGTNAHVVIEQAGITESADDRSDETRPKLLALSARTEEARAELAARYAQWLQTHPEESLEDICHTVNSGRTHFEHRAVLLGSSREEMQQQLDALAKGKRHPRITLDQAPGEGRRRIAFLFPGEGLQYAGMALELYRTQPVFSECLDRCAAVYDEVARSEGSPLFHDLMFQPEGMEKIEQTRHIRPVLYSLQVSLARLWRSWGVEPDVLMGHSAGEYAAACVAGVVSVEDGLRLVMERARLFETLPAGGAMLSVTASAEVVDAILGDDDEVSVSAYNGMNTVISGPEEKLDELIKRFEEEERYANKLPATNAAHSVSVDPILDDFEAFARTIEYAHPVTTLVSGLTGEIVDESLTLDAAYWRSQTRKPVRFAQGVRHMFEQTGCDVVVELGPQAELIWLAQMSHRPEHPVLWTSSLDKGRDSLEHMLSTAAKLHANGTPLAFSGLQQQDREYRLLSMPAYPFQHEHYWAGPMGGVMRTQLQEGVYQLQWDEREARSALPPESRPERWLVLATESAAADRLVADLDALGQKSLRLIPDGAITTPEQMDALLAEAGGTDQIDQLVLLCDLTIPADGDTQAVWDAQSQGVYLALLTGQALVRAKSKTRLWMVTRGVMSVIADERVDPTHAPVWGFGRTYAVEHADHFGGLVDLAPDTEDTGYLDGLAQALVCDDNETQLALRDGLRHIARLRDYPLPDAVTVNPSADGSYLITGGTGALGLHMARHLVDRGARQIVLTSRSGAGEEAQAVIDDLEAAGCRVDVIRADLSDMQAVEQLFSRMQAAEDALPLKGILHAAGVLEGAPTVGQSAELYAKVMAPKVIGGWNLHRRTLDMDLDFFMLFSSGAALLGFPWQGNYAAANAYLDSLAQHRRNLGLAGVSINWGPWAGEGVATRLQALGWEELGTKLISPATATQQFDYLGGVPDAHLCVHPMDWSRWNEQASNGQLSLSLQNLFEELLFQLPAASQAVAELPQTATSAGGAEGPLVRRLAQLDGVERLPALIAHMQERVGEVLGVPASRIDDDSGFFDLGMNSIMAVELRGSLQTDLGESLEIQAATIFNHPTVKRIAEHLLEVLFPDGESPAASNLPAFSASLSEEVSALDSAKLPEAVDQAVAEVLGDALTLNRGDGQDAAMLRKALAAIESLRAEVARLDGRRVDPIAVVGLSCRYPGATDADAFWSLLENAVDAVGEVPASRWDSALWRDFAPENTNMRHGGFMSDVESFDAAFFGISPREARSLDPQQRMLLEVAWEALESAAIAPRDLAGQRGGVFIGIQLADYAQRVNAQEMDDIDAYGGTGNALSAAAGRLAYTLGLQGPALAIDTACSSSLVSLHEACASLRSAETDIALAGGVSLILNPMVSLILSRAQMLSPDGRCKTFDDSANGFVRGEGCGVVVLKRLSDAQRDGDPVMAVIRGSSINQDGRSSGLTVPNGLAQSRLIGETLEKAAVAPADVQYLEAHGTGTSLGDPIEVQAANEVYSKGRADDNPLLIGSVKSNIGHTETAAGIAGVIKLILAMQHQKIPKSLHFNTPNSHIPWSQLNLRVVDEARAWPRDEKPRIAAVSSFGFAGTNAHVVLQEAPLIEAPVMAGERSSPYLLTLSARSETALQALAGRYLAWLQAHADASLADLCYTANVGRNHHEERATLIFDDQAQLETQLNALMNGQETVGVERGRVSPQGSGRIAFLYTGQGSQSVGMGHGLYQHEPHFKACFDRCADAFAEIRPDAPDLRDLVFTEAGLSLIDQTEFTQPALYALEVSLTELWRSRGIEPDVVIGHSVGEYAAAQAAGVFSLEDGLKLIAERGRLMQSLPSGGAMAAIAAPVEVIERAIEGVDGLCIAAFNGAETVISGPESGIEQLIQRFSADEIRCKRLITSHAFHSELMEPILDQYRSFASTLNYSAPRKRLVSNLSGSVISDSEIPDADYWTRHIRQPVQFATGVETLGSLDCDTLLEIGPHPVLIGMGQGCWSGEGIPRWIGSLHRKHEEREQMLSATAQLYLAGKRVDFDALIDETAPSARRISLPTYPFQRQRFWVDAEPGGDRRVSGLGRLLYQIEWKAVSEPGDVAELNGQTWLILGEAAGAGSEIARALETRGCRVEWLSRPSDVDQIAKVIGDALSRATADSAHPLQGILYLWGMESDTPQTDEAFESVQAYGAQAAMLLAQQLIQAGLQCPLWLLTERVHRLQSGEALNPHQAPLWGLGKSITLMNPEIMGGMLDLGSRDITPDQAGLICRLLAAGSAEDQFALRGTRHWVARLRSAAARVAEGRIEPESDKLYLVTGGLGAVGLQIARRLAQRGAGHLVLSARSEPGDEAQKVIGELSELGCEVEVVRADMGVAADVSRLMDRLTAQEMPLLSGIVHAAGIMDTVDFTQLTPARFSKMLAPKALGAWLLDRETRARGVVLDMFVAVSSMASVWGAHGHAHYAAANMYLDALMAARQAEGLPGVSVNYGPWMGPGMSADEESQAMHKRLGLHEIEPERALDGMEQAILANVPQMGVIDASWSVFKPLVEFNQARPLFDELGLAGDEEVQESGASSANAQLEALWAAPESERAGLLTDIIRGQVANVLKVAPDTLADDTSVFDLGMDSLMAMELMTRLRQTLGNDKFSPKLIYEYSTLTQLAGAIAGEAGSFAAAPAESAEDQSAPSELDQRQTIEGNEYLCRAYRESDRADLMVSVGQAFGEDFANNLDAIFDWKFHDNPLTPAQGIQLDVLDIQPGIGGANAGIFANFNLNGDPQLGVWATDAHVVPDHRHASSWFLSSSQKRGVDIALSMPNAEMYPFLTATEAVVDLDQFVVLKAPLDMGAILRARGHHPITSAIAGLSYWPASKAFALASRFKAAEGVEVERVSKFAAWADEIWQQVSRDYSGIMVRDSAFLQWRFDRCSNREYTRYLARRDGKPVGYLVTRHRQIDGEHRGIIVDFLIPRSDEALLHSLLQQAVSDFREQGVVSMVCAISSSQHQLIKLLRSNGFMFQEPGAHVVAAQGAGAAALAGINDWYFTFADGDMDFCSWEEES